MAEQPNPKTQATVPVEAEASQPWFSDHEIQKNLTGTGILLSGVLVARFLAVRAIRNWQMPTQEHRLRWLISVRNFSLVVLLFGLVLIWGEELKTLALSMVAVAAACVIATKELILCFSGSVLRSSTGSFGIGDRIEVNAIRGDVINHNMLTTTILEIGPGQTSHQATGRSIVIPNSVFLSAPVINETFLGNYVLHHISVPLKADQDWRGARSILLEVATVECAPYLEEAKACINKLTTDHSVEAPGIDPRITIQLPEPDRVNLLLRIPAPARFKGRIEQAILEGYQKKFHEKTPDGSGAEAPSPE